MIKEKLQSTKLHLKGKAADSEAEDSDMSNEEAEDTLENLLPGDTDEREKALFDMVIEKFSENLH